MNQALQYLALYLINQGITLTHSQTLIRTKLNILDHWYSYCIMQHQNDLIVDSLWSHDYYPYHIPLEHPTAFEQIHQLIIVHPPTEGGLRYTAQKTTIR